MGALPADLLFLLLETHSMSADLDKPPLAPPSRNVKPVAVIDIGRLDPHGDRRNRRRRQRRILETLSQAVNLGRDTFTKSSIDRATIEECVRMLRTYARSLKEYGIAPRPDSRGRHQRGPKRPIAWRSWIGCISPPRCRSIRSTKRRSIG